MAERKGASGYAGARISPITHRSELVLARESEMRLTTSDRRWQRASAEADAVGHNSRSERHNLGKPNRGGPGSPKTVTHKLKSRSAGALQRIRRPSFHSVFCGIRRPPKPKVSVHNKRRFPVCLQERSPFHLLSRRREATNLSQVSHLQLPISSIPLSDLLENCVNRQKPMKCGRTQTDECSKSARSRVMS